MRSAVAVAAIAALATSGSASSAPRATTVAIVPGIVRSLAAGPGRLAWIDSYYTLFVRGLASGRTAKIEYSSPYQEGVADTMLAFAGSEPVWRGERGPLDRSVDHAFTLTRGGRVVHSAPEVNQPSGTSGYVTSVAGDPSGGAYAVAVLQGSSLAGGGVGTIADGSFRRLPGFPPAVLVARSGSLIAAVPAAQETTDGAPVAASPPMVEVRRIDDGRAVASFSPAAPVQSLAFAPGLLYTLSRTASASTIEVHDPGDGRTLRTLRLPYPVAKPAASGSWLVVRTERRVLAYDGRTGRLVPIARTQGTIAQAVVRAGRVYWAEVRLRAHPAGLGDRVRWVSFLREAALP